MLKKEWKINAVITTAVLAALAGCGSGSIDVNVKPVYLGTIATASYDGAADDLLTAGLGKTGLGGAAPAAANPLQPTPAELRRLAIYNNYRALVDITTAGGYGLLYGPNIDAKGNDTLGEGKIAGSEYIAYSDDGTGNQNITMMVQIPATFNPASACIITGTSSGSRGVYGAIGTSGEWGLKNNCAVAYHDKGTGLGVHDLQNNTVNLQNGVRTDAVVAGKNSNFTASLTDAERAAFNAATPNRFAVKHAHSQQNPEKDWGKWTLQSIEFAYYVLNEKYGAVIADGRRVRTLKPENTIVIASSASNGAGAALAAAEQDTGGLITGIAVSEPQVQLAPDARLTVKRGATSMVGTGKTIYDYFTLANLMQPCAGLLSTATNVFTTLNPVTAANRCAALKANGLITGTTTEEMAASAMAALTSAGWQPESNDLQASHYSFATLPVALSYANAYGRFSVKDNLCGFSYGATTATGVPLLSVQGATAKLEGKFEISDSIQIECEIGGEMTVGGKLLIGQNGIVRADVHTVDAVIMGQYDGNLVASGDVEIAATGRVTGNIETDSLVIAKGGFFNGNVTKKTRAADATAPEYVPTERIAISF